MAQTAKQIEARLIDGEAKIAAAYQRGEDTTALVDFWIGLLHEYEDMMDAETGTTRKEVAPVEATPADQVPEVARYRPAPRRPAGPRGARRNGGRGVR